MDRVKWTDDLIDERMAAIDDALDRQFKELRLLREEMRVGFAGLRTESQASVTQLRSEMHAGFAELRTEIAAVNRQLVVVLTAFLVALLGLVGAQTF